MAKMLSAEEARIKAAGMCSVAEKCVSEIEDKLQKWGISEEDSQNIISYLLKERFIDESRYARYYAKDKFLFSKWGKAKIAFSLRSKNIDKKFIDDALDAIGNDDYVEQVEGVLRSKFRTLKYKDLYDAKAKLLRFGAGRGFESKVLFSAVDKILGAVGEDDVFYEV